jgi:hypothetical protein
MVLDAQAKVGQQETVSGLAQGSLPEVMLEYRAGAKARWGGGGVLAVVSLCLGMMSMVAPTLMADAGAILAAWSFGPQVSPFVPLLFLGPGVVILLLPAAGLALGTTALRLGCGHGLLPPAGMIMNGAALLGGIVSAL